MGTKRWLLAAVFLGVIYRDAVSQIDSDGAHELAQRKGGGENLVTDRFGRAVDGVGLTLVDWEGHLANPVIEFHVRPPSSAILPIFASLSANAARLYFSDPSTTSGDGPTKSLIFTSTDPQRVLVSIAPDRDFQDEQYSLTVEFGDIASTTRILDLYVIDQDIERANEFAFALDFSEDDSGFFDGVLNSRRDVVQQAADDWGYFIADMNLDLVDAGQEFHFIWNWPLAWTGPFPNSHSVTNAVTYEGFHLWPYGINTAEIRAGGEPSDCCFQSSGGNSIMLRRSGGLEIDVEGDHNNLGWNSSLLDDDWWVTRQFSGDISDLYSVAQHEVGHAIAFDDRYPNFNSRQVSGFSSAKLTTYFGGTVFVDSGPNHFVGVLDPASRKGAYGNDFDGEVPLRRWYITKLNLLLLEVIGYELRDTSPFREVSVADGAYPTGFLDVPYNGSLVADGGIPFYDWSLEAGSLPPGLSLNPFTGSLDGTPATDGTFEFTIRLRDYSDDPGVAVAASVTLIAVQIPPQPLPESTPLLRDRDISFIVPVENAGQETALELTLNSLYHPSEPFPINPADFSAREGEARYVNLLRDEFGDPVTSCQSSAAFSIAYRCATLRCQPEYADWAGLFGGDVIHVSGNALVPDSRYSVVQLAASCAGNESSCAAVSEELELATARHGDADGNGLVNVTDVVVTVDAAKQVFGAAWEYQCYVRKQDPQPHLDAVNVTDIVIHVDALKLIAYHLDVPACP